MEDSPLQRLSILFSPDTLARLRMAKVAVFGVGGVGSWCAEALVRSGINEITLVDSDRVALSNINRQLPALESTVGEFKVNALALRLSEIRGGVTIHPVAKLYTQDSRTEFDWANFDYVIDAIDSVNSKIDLLMYAKERGCSVFCSLGAAGKLDPTLVRAVSIWKTSGCPLGRLVRTGLRNRNFTGDFTAVYSEEHPREGYCVITKEGGKPALGSFVAVTATFGMTLASLVVRDIEARAEKSKVL
ncbi:MAG: tRNA threonylcarbamoyladenosine dehydratase [Fibrobacteraceae bacterium]